MDARARYFRLMEAVNYELMCINLLLKKNKKRETASSIFLAVFSGSGVASWFIWSAYAHYAALAVAASQVLFLSLPFLEFRKKIETLIVASAGMQALSDKMDDQWPYVKNLWPDDKIERAMRAIKKRQRELLKRPNEICPVDDKTAAKAEARLKNFLKKYY